MSDKRAPSAIDTYIGSIIRRQRKLRGLTQKQLGQYLGVSFQQVQKYEKGVSKVNIERLQAIANILDLPLLDLLKHTMSTRSTETLPYNHTLGVNNDPTAHINSNNFYYPLANSTQHATILRERASAPFSNASTTKEEVLQEAEHITLLKYFTQISDKSLRQQLLDMAESLSKVKK